MIRTSSKSTASRDFAAHFHLLGSVDYEDCATAQRRLAYDALSRGDGRIAILICEHPPLITIGRAGSRGHVRMTGSDLAERQLAVRYVGRGGGAVLHGPGQVAVYPIVPLEWHGWSVGEYLRRLQRALTNTLADFSIRPQATAGRFSLAGRTGLLAAVGVSVKHGVTGHGAWLNVNPDMRDFGRVEVAQPAAGITVQPAAGMTAPGQKLSSLLSERPLPVKMAAVRASLVSHLAAALGCERHHLHTGHPLLADLPISPARDSASHDSAA